MKIKMNFAKAEMDTIEKLHKAYSQAFGREDHYEVTGPVRFSVNHMEGEGTGKWRGKTLRKLGIQGKGRC